MKIRILQMFLFVVSGIFIILILYSPQMIFGNSYSRDLRLLFSKQNISFQKLFLSAWTTIKNSYYDETLNNQDWNKWKKRYYNYIKTEEDVKLAVDTMLVSLNDYNSKFFNKKQNEIQEKFISENNELEAIKITIPDFKTETILPQKTQQSSIIQLKTIAGFVQYGIVVQCSSENDNLKVGDKILALGGYNLKNFEQNSVINLVKNLDSAKPVYILRKNKIIKTKLEAGSIAVDKIYSRKLQNDIVYIYIASMMGKSAAKEIHQILKTHNDSAKGYILDLRGNIGGLVINSIYIAEQFMKNGDMFTVKYRTGQKYTFKVEKPSEFKLKPMVILIDRRTASSSEILAGILRSNNCAVLVGEKTYGKHSIQQIIPLPNQTCLNLTVAGYEFPNKYKLEYGKIVPDFIVPLRFEDIFFNKDRQLNKAIEILSK